MSLDFDYLYFTDHGDRVNLHSIDCVAKKAVAILHGAVFDEEGVGFRGFQRIQGIQVVVGRAVVRDKDGVVVHVALIEGVVSDAVNDLKLASGGTSRQHEG